MKVTVTFPVLEVLHTGLSRAKVNDAGGDLSCGESGAQGCFHVHPERATYRPSKNGKPRMAVFHNVTVEVETPDEDIKPKSYVNWSDASKASHAVGLLAENFCTG